MKKLALYLVGGVILTVLIRLFFMKLGMEMNGLHDLVEVFVDALLWILIGYFLCKNFNISS